MDEIISSCKQIKETSHSVSLAMTTSYEDKLVVQLQKYVTIHMYLIVNTYIHVNVPQFARDDYVDL